ncbi:bifunctional diguanylate cyclase/phosphodiesterase [Amorphus orientalis]|uniref:Diguanylate cyclase (GGDEF)-like protein n=1 Tax=Amorphus orientalis TaxID=649198 RepID=A0AAE3VM45_9HYPH|nr:EAL domain-containing protein [Amorphus orientalis]MDQ0314567.1 diguanylate cyclase (GGDEF)-like protein [Amorphus orientalis]
MMRSASEFGRRLVAGRSGNWIWVISGAAVLGYVLLTGWNLIALRQQTLEETREVAVSMARLLDQEVSLIADKIDIAQTALVWRIENAARVDGQRLYPKLSELERQLNFVQRIFVIDETGTLRADSGDPDPPGISFADRDFFAAHRDDPGREAFVGQPVTGRLTGSPNLPVTRRFANSLGEFGGVVGFALDLEAMRPALLENRPTSDTVVAIFHDDGTMLLRAPDPERVTGRSFLNYPLFKEHLPRRDAGVFLSEEQSDQVARYVAYRRVEDQPLIVAVAIGREEVLSSWRDHVGMELLKFVLLLVTVAGAGVISGRAIRAHRSVEDKLQTTLNATLVAERRHRTMLDALPANLVLLDHDGTVLLGNSNWHHFADANHYLGEDHAVGLNYLTICDNATGECSQEAAPAAEGIREVLAGRQKEFSLEYPCHSPDRKRWFRLMVGAVNLGDRRGAVAMHIDVTARKLAELSLENEHSRIRRLSQSLPGVLFRLRQDSADTLRWDSLSERGWDMFGISPGAVVASNRLLEKVVPPAEFPGVQAAFERHFRNGEPLDIEFPIRCREGEIRWLKAVASIDTEEVASTDRVSDGVFLDITAERTARGQLEYLRAHDPLTGLANREEVQRQLEHYLGRPRAESETGTALLLIGIDRFVDLNRAYGGDVGDAIIKGVADRLRSKVRSADLLARIGDDEFAILQDDVLADSDAATLATKIIDAFDEALSLVGRTIRLSVSVGISRPQPGVESATEALGNAGAALELARTEGPGVFRFPGSEKTELDSQTRVAMRDGLASAIENEEFELHFQPRVRVKDGKITGAEALLRWAHPTFGLQSPAKFIPVAERSGQIIQIGQWVLQEACRLTREWIDAGHSDIRVSVNASAVQLRRTDFPTSVEKALSEHGLPPEALEIEMTESAALDPGFGEAIGRLRELGVSIAIDDFGTGYSSFSYVRRFQIDVIKIDQSFVRNLLNTEEDRAIAKAIIDMARALGISTTAEGVERAEEVDVLRRLNCDEIQGYYFAPPMTAEDFVWFLTEGATQIRAKFEAIADNPARPEMQAANER